MLYPSSRIGTVRPRFFAPLLLLLSLLNQAAFVYAQNSSDLSWVPFNRDQFDGDITLDTEDGNVHLFWRRGEEYSTYGIASRSAGYLALGFSETGAMTGADIALGYRNTSGQFVLENRHATDFVTPDMSPDQTSNIRLIEGDQRDGVTGFVFEKRNRAECLTTQVDVEDNSWQWFIYAFSEQNTFSQHAPGHNGKKYVKLGTGQTVSVNEIVDVPNARNFTITQPEITIPTQETTYCYTMHKLPEGQKNFILGERPALSSDLLHHLVVYACHGITEEDEAMVGSEPNCDFENFSNPCNGFVTEWAPGMSGRTFEPGFGKPFGSDSYEYVMLETHYNNPNGLEGQTDSAGYTFLYNDEAVETEIGTLTLGALQVTGWTLEPGQELAPHVTVCTPECTERWPAEGITAVSVFFHMHQRGRNARVQVIRAGEEIASLSSIRDFEYGYQFSKSLPEIQLLPGDRLITTCEFDTTQDTQPVPGGLASKDEMCFAWVDYYPANQVLACTQVDLGNEPGSLLNGTNAICLDSSDPESMQSVYPSGNLTAPFQQLPASGNTCSAQGSGDETNQSGVAPPSPSPTGAAALLTIPTLFVAFWAFISVAFTLA